MDQLIIDYGTHLVTPYDFVILLGQNIDQQYAYQNLYFGQKKNNRLQVKILDFYHKLFP